MFSDGAGGFDPKAENESRDIEIQTLFIALEFSAEDPEMAAQLATLRQAATEACQMNDGTDAGGARYHEALLVYQKLQAQAIVQIGEKDPGEAVVATLRGWVTNAKIHCDAGDIAGAAEVLGGDEDVTLLANQIPDQPKEGADVAISARRLDDLIITLMREPTKVEAEAQMEILRKKIYGLFRELIPEVIDPNLARSVREQETIVIGTIRDSNESEESKAAVQTEMEKYAGLLSHSADKVETRDTRDFELSSFGAVMRNVRVIYESGQTLAALDELDPRDGSEPNQLAADQLDQMTNGEHDYLGKVTRMIELLSKLRKLENKTSSY